MGWRRLALWLGCCGVTSACGGSGPAATPDTGTGLDAADAPGGPDAVSCGASGASRPPGAATRMVVATDTAVAVAPVTGGAAMTIAAVVGDALEAHVDPTSGQVAWLEWVNGGPSAVRRAALDGSGVTTPITIAGDGPVDLAMDPEAGIYVAFRGTDGGGPAGIRHAPYGGGTLQPVPVTAGTPTALALDVGAGHLYWTTRAANQGAIWRARLDGTCAREVVATAGPAIALTLDLHHQTLYWLVADLGIQRANLDGTDATTVIAAAITLGDVEVDGASGQLYWSDYVRSQVSRAGLDGSNPAPLVTVDRPIGLALAP